MQKSLIPFWFAVVILIPQAPIHAETFNEIGRGQGTVCYVENQAGQTFDLNPLCSPRGRNGLLTTTSAPSRSNSSFSRVPMVSLNAWGYWGDSSSGGSSGGSGSEDNNCKTASDLAADGSRCGGRADDQRPGGR
jgi:hypothetical protein